MVYGKKKIILRNVNKKNSHEVKFLQTKIGEKIWGKKEIDHLIGIVGGYGKIIFLDGYSIGFIMARILGDHSEILSMGVCDKHRRRGYGSKLIEELEKNFVKNSVRKCFLEVNINNEAAISLYYSQGFTSIRKIDKYYKRKNIQEDALVLSKAYI
jgi:ribosomal-protein-alanine N-acetyltransferase|tara:strand:+ start:2210 stop:2674 length:465 start_codon:yes stop_codon:yes gene_type:complete